MSKTTNAKSTVMKLDERGLSAARKNIEDGAMTPAYGPWRDDVVPSARTRSA